MVTALLFVFSRLKQYLLLIKVIVMVKLKMLMVIERFLLEIDIRFKFMLDFGRALKLHDYLKDIGRITSYSFLIQDEFQQKYNDLEKLKEYHDKIMDSEIEYNISEVVKFIEDINEEFKDEEFDNIILKNKFW